MNYQNKDMLFIYFHVYAYVFQMSDSELNSLMDFSIELEQMIKTNKKLEEKKIAEKRLASRPLDGKKLIHNSFFNFLYFLNFFHFF